MRHLPHIDNLVKATRMCWHGKQFNVCSLSRKKNDDKQKYLLRIYTGTSTIYNNMKFNEYTFLGQIYISTRGIF